MIIFLHLINGTFVNCIFKSTENICQNNGKIGSNIIDDRDTLNNGNIKLFFLIAPGPFA